MSDLLANPLFERYLALLLKWNKIYNLTSIKDPKEVTIKHFEDSLSLAPFLSEGARLLDIGTGAGFPGIPLRIVRPDLHVFLLDSVRKKTDFCKNLIRELDLGPIEVIQGRAEDPILVQKLGLFDVVVSRATFSLKDFLTIAANFTKENGLGIAMKGRDWESEYEKTSLWNLEKVFDYDLSQNFGKRSLLLFRLKKVVLKQ